MSHLSSPVVCLFCFCFVLLLIVVFPRSGFTEALEPALKLDLVDQHGLELTEFCLPLPIKCWD